jgi:hypothetical protein
MTGALRPHTSIGHSRPTERGLPAPNCRNASWVRRTASPGLSDPLRPFGHGAQNAYLVAHLVQQAVALINGREINLTQ